MKGYAILSFLILFPALFALLAGGYLIAAVVREYSDQQRICRETVLDIQRSFLSGLQRLSALNPRAQSLRLQRMAIEAQIALAASTPHLLPPLLAQREKIRAEQLALSALQKSVRTEAEVKAKVISTRLSFTPGFGKVRGTQGIAVKASPTNSLSPSYYPVSNFTDEQKNYVSWSRKVSALPRFLTELFSISEPIRGECGASLIEIGVNQWKVSLYKAKPLLSF